MTADVTYITSFRQLRLSGQRPGHFELLPGVNISVLSAYVQLHISRKDTNISNDPAVKKRLLTPDYGRAAGVIELTHLLQQADNLVFVDRGQRMTHPIAV